MSQKKMDAYKEAKKNVRKLRKKEKTKRVIAWIIGIICAAALIAASVFLIYYTNVLKPEKEKAAAEAVSQENASDAVSDEAVKQVTEILQDNAGQSDSDVATDAEAGSSEGSEGSEGSENSDTSDSSGDQ